ncbi:glycosyltransferase family 2 protein [Candidatus Micrarchaeota archaeon]|nr:glycosyltransferase family 2 protein [Candidatus Micrarchaeota archaeon]
MVQISVILPTRNEAECIKTSLSTLTSELKSDSLDYEILIVDDGSNDGTQQAVLDFSKSDPRVKLIARSPPYGFGISIREGIAKANGELTVIMMADLSDDPRFIRPMWEKFQQGYDVIVGSRFMSGSKVIDYPILKNICNRLFNYSVMLMFWTSINDTSNNFKAFRSSKVKTIGADSNGFEVGAELMVRMLLAKYKVVQIPVSWQDRTAGTAKFKLSKTFDRYFSLFLKMIKLAYLR